MLPKDNLKLLTKTGLGHSQLYPCIENDLVYVLMDYISPVDMYHQINTKVSDSPDCISIAQWSEHWYVKTAALGSIPGWGSQITFS